MGLLNLHELFIYEPSTGLLVRRANGRIAGFENGNGYLRAGCGGRQLYVHQIAWAMIYGEVPDGEIDHADGDTYNNRIENLRLTDRFGNTQNTRKRAHSSQPYKGVRPARNRSGKWTARIGANKNQKHLGTFETAEQAYNAYCAASAALHGEFGRLA